MKTNYQVVNCSNKHNMNLRPLNPKELISVFRRQVGKYASKHDPYRFYLVDYKTDYNFYTHTYNNGKLIGSSWGTYEIFDLGLTGGVLNVKYKSIKMSPNKDSDMNIISPFYPKLENFVLGPFYTQCLDEKAEHTPIITQYIKEEYKQFEILNFYNREKFDIRSY